MPRGINQKLKLYYLSRIMTEKTDDEHHITMNLYVHVTDEEKSKEMLKFEEYSIKMK